MFPEKLDSNDEAAVNESPALNRGLYNFLTVTKSKKNERGSPVTGKGSAMVGPVIFIANSTLKVNE
jgi:hypothetical protein